MRSSRSTRSFLIESSIWRIPACRPLVQTLVATKSFGPMPSSAASAPHTDSAEPYIGELSTTRPPRSTRALSASRACAVSAALPETSKACQVPSPTAGIVSPDLGIDRSRIRSAARAAGMTPPKESAAASFSQVRREMRLAGLPGAFIVWNDGNSSSLAAEPSAAAVINGGMISLLHRLGAQIAPEFEQTVTAALNVALILVLAWAGWKLCTHLLRVARERMVTRSAGADAVNRIETMMQVLRYAASALIVIVSGMLTLDQLGIAIGPLVATAGVAGVAVGLGLQSLMKDYFAGVVLLIEDQIRKGDVIEAASKAGLVEEMTLRYVRVRDYDGNVHFIPNGAITTVTNLSREYAYAVIDAGIAYRADIDRAFGVMRGVASEMRADGAYSSRIREDLEVAGVERWENSAVVLRARLKVAPLEQWNVKREFLRRLKYAFDAAGIEIPYPHLTVYAGNSRVSGAGGSAMRNVAARE